MAAKSKYASEQGDPTVGSCKVSVSNSPSPRLKLSFNGTSLILSGGTVSHVYPAVSGARGKDPIPGGRYWINPAEIAESGWRHPKMWLASAAWGSHRVTIHPYAETAKTLNGHGGYFIHGGSAPGSAGCIDLVGKMADFVKDLQAELGKGSGDCHIELNVTYAKK